MIRRQQGMTLVELIITIVIVGIAAAALYTAMAAITARSADPMLRQQSLMIAEAYLEEILQQSFAQLPQPDGCARVCYNDVRDYAGLADMPPRDAQGSALDTLANYRVEVAVQSLPDWNGIAALQVDVSVTDPAGAYLTLTGYRANY